MGEIKDFWLVLCPGNWNPMDSEVAFEKVILIICIYDTKGQWTKNSWGIFPSKS